MSAAWVQAEFGSSDVATRLFLDPALNRLMSIQLCCSGTGQEPHVMQYLQTSGLQHTFQHLGPEEVLHPSSCVRLWRKISGRFLRYGGAVRGGRWEGCVSYADVRTLHLLLLCIHRLSNWRVKQHSGSCHLPLFITESMRQPALSALVGFSSRIASFSNMLKMPCDTRRSRSCLRTTRDTLSTKSFQILPSSLSAGTRSVFQ
ncbi:hypothetical protein GOODEAATRI_025527 [Goodea atripinnis]|uniref:Uncharacterized protein n=1 Tax=Goodea atripinnis TaxID=208336 RepID=A0ABV0PRL0_9TELE